MQINFEMWVQTTKEREKITIQKNKSYPHSYPHFPPKSKPKLDKSL